MNRKVKLYRSAKRPSGAWGTKPVPDKQLKNLKDLPEGEGKYYLAYYKGKDRQMPPVGRFADAAKQKLVQKRKELDARAQGVELPPEPEQDPEWVRQKSSEGAPGSRTATDVGRHDA